MSYASTVSAPIRQFHPVFWQKTCTYGPTSGANYFRGEQLEYLKYRQYFGSIYCEYISGFGTADALYLVYSKYFGSRCCGYSGTRSTC